MLRHFPGQLLFPALVLVACGGEPPLEAPLPPPPSSGASSSEGAGEIQTPEGRLPRDVQPRRYSLTLAIDPRQEAFTGVVEIDLELEERERAIHLHASGLDISEVSVADRAGNYEAAEWALVDDERELARITPTRPVGPGSVRLRIAYGGAFGRALEGLYRVEQDDAWYAFTQMEPLGARKAFPCFDEPSFKTPWDVTLVVPEGQTAIANGPQTGQQATTGGMQRVRFGTTQPLPTYLIAFAVGPLDVVEGPPIAPTEVRSRPIPFRAVAPRGQGERLRHALEHTPRILHALEDYFGIPYPYAKLDIIAVPDFGAGAMENAGAITFRDVLLLLGDAPSVSQQRGFAYVMAHELAHQWFGNLVTMDWWDDLWLNEAFANWMEAHAIRSTFPEFQPGLTEMEVSLSAMRADSLSRARQIRQPIESTHDIHNAFDSITYNKGNAVLAMFESYLSPETFRRGVQRYLQEHAGGNARAEDLVNALNATLTVGPAATQDVRPAFESFLVQPGVPWVDVEPRCAEGGASLRVTQTRYRPLGSNADSNAVWQIPFCVRYRADGQDHRACQLLTAQESTVALQGCPDWVMPNAGGTGYYRWTLPATALEALRTNGFAELDVREAMSFVDNIEASHVAGRIGFSDALAALAPLASRDERPLATAPMGMISFALDHLLTDEPARRSAREFGARLYRSRARRLGWSPRRGEDPELTLLRAEVLEFMADVARDPATRREANRRGRAYLGVGRSAMNEAAVAPDLAELAVRVAVQQGGAEVFEVGLSRFRASHDAVVRGNVLRGISSTTDAALGARALELALDDDLRVNEVFRPLMAQTGQPETRTAAYAWVTEHYDAISERIGPSTAGYLSYTGVGFCSAEQAGTVQGFFEPRAANTLGGPRNLELVIERIRLCASRAEYARTTLEGAF